MAGCEEITPQNILACSVSGTIEVQLATPFDIVISFVLPVACATCLFGYLAFRLVAKMVNRGVGR